jgi:hypothetical protein
MFRSDEYPNRQNGIPSQFANTAHGRDSNSMARTQGHEGGLLSPPYINEVKPRSINDTNSPADSLLDLYAGNKADGPGDTHKRMATDASGTDSGEDSSKWIHRDKLAKIENEELQAAGIVLPRAPRSRSKSNSRSRRDQSQDKANGRARSRKNSEIALDPRTPELSTVPSWDLRLPEEIAEENDGYFIPHSLSAKGSKIPIAKTSPLPLPIEHIERDMPIPRKRDSSPSEEDTITYPKTRNRSGSLGNPMGTGVPMANGPAKRAATDTSPKKPGARKTSAKSATGGAARPRTRGGPSKDSTSSGTGTRPSTRSGELSPGNKQMEGEPPWMVSAYRPDPRLPPEQQLLPTVARRLQQEKWEREGKFGNVYDKEFRPLTDEGFLKPPEPVDRNAAGGEEPTEEEKADSEWPLKADLRKSPSLRQGRAGSYSTMPKVKDPLPSPLPSPMNPGQQLTQVPSIVRVPDAPEPSKDEGKKDAGCGCCIVM